MTLFLTKTCHLFFGFFALTKSKQAEIVAFNGLIVNYIIHFIFYECGDQTTRVDSCDKGQKNMEWKNE